MQLVISNLVSAVAGLIIGVLFEDYLKRWRDRMLRAFRAPFRRRRHQVQPPHTLSFGDLTTTWNVIDGDGNLEYAPETIQCHYDQRPLELPPDLAERKQRTQEQQEERRKNGLPYFWNGERYALETFLLSRTDTEQNMVLDLWFRPSDYYTFLAAEMSLDDQEVRNLYLRDVDWQKPVPFFSNSLGINIAVISADGYVVISRRAEVVGSRPSEYNISANEALSRLLDRDTDSYAPNMYRCAIRGVTEELGLELNASDIALLSFGVDTQYCQWGLLGMANTHFTADEIMHLRAQGVQDKWENGRLYVVRFTPDDVAQFVFSHGPWAPGALACLYHSLIKMYSRARVDEAIRRRTQSAARVPKSGG
jgi:hypothetical protein